MNRPERKVMSMVPNKSYLEGYNDCVEEMTRYDSEISQLLKDVLQVGWTGRNHPDNDALIVNLKARVTDFLLAEAKRETNGDHRMSGHGVINED